MKRSNLVKLLTAIAAICLMLTVFTACDLGLDKVDLSLRVKFVVNDEVYYKVTTTKGATIDLPESPRKDEWIFDGWYFDNGTFEKPFDGKVDGDGMISIMVYAKWKACEHNVVHVAAKAPTCLEVGWDAYDRCPTCYYTTYVEKAALGHIIKQGAAQEANESTLIGWDAYEYCDREGCDYTTKQERPWHEHKDEITIVEAKAATCTEYGWSAYYTCSHDGCDFTAEQLAAHKIDAKGHKGGTATCQAKAICTVCGNEYGELGDHDFDETTWVQGETSHYHACKTSGCTEVKDEAAHADDDNDHNCDTCGKTVSTHAGGTATCQAKAICTICGNEYGDLADHDFDETTWAQGETSHYHACKTSGCTEVKDEAAHADDDNDHACDVCKKIVSTCADANKDHKCDTCSATMGEHTPKANNTHECAYCGKSASDCVDTDKNHACDVCGATMGEHMPKANNTHECAYCGKSASDCVDTDKNHACDVCGATMGDHTPKANNTHECAYCGKSASDCVDTDKNHACDVCGAKLSEHDFSAEAAENKYLKTDATCTKNAVYYKSCSACGASSKDTADEATFEKAESALGHAKGANDTCTKCSCLIETISIATYASANEWINSTQYKELTATLSGVVLTVTEEGRTHNTGKYYTNGTNWRFYQNENPSLTFTTSGCVLVSVKITYSVDNTGTLTYAGKQIESGVTVAVIDNTITFGVGNTGSKTNGQVRITAIEIAYTLTDEQKVDRAMNALTVAENSNDLPADGKLPVKSGDVTISWASSNAAAIAVTSDGNYTVTKQDGIETVTLTATFKCGDVSKTKTYTVTVPAAVCGHTNATYVTEKPATCQTNGNIEYWYCEHCGKYFSNRSYTTEITAEETVTTSTHDYDETTWEKDTTKHWHACKTSGCTSKSAEAAHTYENGVCTECGEKEIVTKDLTLTFDSTAKREDHSTTKSVWIENGIIFTLEKGSGNPIVDNINPIRCYQGSKITISCGTKKISKIVFTFNETYSGGYNSSFINGKTITLTFETALDSYTNTQAAQLRLTKVVVTVADDTTEGGSGSEGGETGGETTQLVSVGKLTFSAATNGSSVSNYTTTWDATCGDKTWTIVNFNNNRNGWSYIKCGQKQSTSSASIATSSVTDAVQKVVVNLQVNSNCGSLTSVTLTVKDADANIVDTVTSFTPSEKDVVFMVSVPTSNCSYELKFDYNNTTNNNGTVSVNSVEYFA